MTDEQKKDQTSDIKPADDVKVEEKKEEKPQVDQAKPEDQKPAEKTEKKPVEKKEDKPAPPVSPKASRGGSGKYKDLIKQIEELSVLELSELVKELEDRFGVSAAAPMAVAPQGAAGAEADAAGADEKAIYTVHLAVAGDQKINVIKALREITGLGLKDAKDMADQAPKDVKTDVPKEEAEEMKKKLEEAGATVELK